MSREVELAGALSVTRQSAAVERTAVVWADCQLAAVGQTSAANWALQLT